jgi:hypothetical protein
MAHLCRNYKAYKIRYFNYQSIALIVSPDGWGFRIVPLDVRRKSSSTERERETIQRFWGEPAPGKFPGRSLEREQLGGYT